MPGKPLSRRSAPRIRRSLYEPLSLLASDQLFVHLDVTEDRTRSMAPHGFYFLRIAGLNQRRGLGSSATFSMTSRRSWSGSLSHSCAISWRASHLFASLASRSSGGQPSAVSSALPTYIQILASS